jgi:sortase (surface protein transpeptidase)
MHLAVNLPAGIDYSARAYLARRRTRVTVAAATASLALLLAAVPAARGRASDTPAVPPAAVSSSVIVTAVETPAQSVATEAARPPPAEVALRTAFPAPIAGDAVTRIVIPSIGVNHAVERVGVGADGTMEAPDDGVRGVGWYDDWATPGSGGNAVFSAHETWNLQHAPFFSLHLLEAGDTLTVRMRSGMEYRYVVASNRRYAADTMPLGQIIWPPARPDSEEWATFITCGGRFVRLPSGYWDYLDRDIIVARRVS